MIHVAKLDRGDIITNVDLVQIIIATSQVYSLRLTPSRAAVCAFTEFVGEFLYLYNFQSIVLLIKSIKCSEN